MGAEIAALLTEHCYFEMEAPVLRVGGYNIPYPPARAEEAYLPDADRILEAIDMSLAY
jgi:pyruvate dehydrogenase E1 component beta subunit